MNRFFVAAAVVALMVSASSAQKFEFGVHGGLGSAAGEELQDANITTLNGDPVSRKDIYGSGGNGLKILAEVAYFINENIGIVAMGGKSMNGGYTTQSTSNDVAGTTVIKNTTTASYVPVNLGLEIRAKIGIIMPYVYMAPGLYFPNEKRTTTNSSWYDENFTYTFTTGFGFTAGAGAAIMVSDKIGVKVEVSPTYAFANLTQYTDKSADNTGLYTTTTYIYKNNTAPLPPSTANTFYINGQQRRSFSSIAVNLGVFIDL